MQQGILLVPHQGVFVGHGQSHQGVCKIVPVDHKSGAVPDACQPTHHQCWYGRRYLQGPRKVTIEYRRATISLFNHEVSNDPENQRSE